MIKKLLLGCAATGAKYTPCNHRVLGNRVRDAINAGDLIACTRDEVACEMRHLHDAGVRYHHHHARNPQTREQSCSLALYREIGNLARECAPHAALSFGGSRNGPEIDQAVSEHGEWARIAHVRLSLDEGGAHFVTAQAAVELQIARDAERKGFVRFNEATGDFKVLRHLAEYVPDATIAPTRLEVNASCQARNYGASSPSIQLSVLRRTIAARIANGLPFEVEWVQAAPSHFLTWFATHVLSPSVAQCGRLNITVLFGFSPKLPFPENYADFRRTVGQALRVAEGANPPLKVSVICGAAVLPQHAAKHIRPLDVGPLAGLPLGPMERLVAYACQPDSGVDGVRVGLEDSPYMLDGSGRVMPTTNLFLAERAVQLIDIHGAEIIQDRHEVANWLAATDEDGASATTIAA